MTNKIDDLPVQRHRSATPLTASERSPAPWSVRHASLTAGVSLLLMSALAIVGNVVVVDGLVSVGDPARTATDITADAGLFRLGIVSLMLVIALDVVVAWALYRVFSPVSASLSMLAAAMRLVYSAVFMVAVAQLVSVIRLLSDDGARAVLSGEQLAVQAMQGIVAFNDIWYVAQLLFGLHLVLLGYLAYRSGYIPRVLGALLVIAGAGYTTDSLGAVLSADAWTDISAFTFAGEFLLAIWLVLRSRTIAAGAATLETAPSRERVGSVLEA